VKIAFHVLVAALWLAVTVVGESRAQEPSPTPNPVGRGAVVARPAVQLDFSAVVALKVSVVLAKYQNEKRISNLPYELTVRTDGKNASIRMGARVPLPEANFVPAPPAPPAKPGEPPAKAPPPLQSFSFRDVGTNIDCTATNLDAGRYAVTVTIEDTSVFTAADSLNTAGQRGSGLPTLRTFRTTNALVLRDGQSTEFTAATDKITGEVTKAEVRISVIK
jgi:hypothetical protein